MTIGYMETYEKYMHKIMHGKGDIRDLTNDEMITNYAEILKMFTGLIADGDNTMHELIAKRELLSIASDILISVEIELKERHILLKNCVTTSTKVTQV